MAPTLPVFAASLRDTCGRLLEGLHALAVPHDPRSSGGAAYQMQGLCADVAQALHCHLRKNEE